PGPLAAHVQVPNAQPSFQGDTVIYGPSLSPYATVIVPNLQPSTSYPYTVTPIAPGFLTVNGPPPAATTSTDNSFTQVFLLLSPATVNVTVEFDTSAFDPRVVGPTLGTEAIVGITPGNLSVTTKPPSSPPPWTYYSGTLTLQTNTTYQYSALFTQF